MNFKKLLVSALVILLSIYIVFSQDSSLEKSKSKANSENGEEKPKLIIPNDPSELEGRTSLYELADSNIEAVKFIREEDLSIPMPVVNYPPEYYEHIKKSDDSSPQ